MQNEVSEVLIDATQPVKGEAGYKKDFETGKKLNRAYCEELPGLTVRTEQVHNNDNYQTAGHRGY